MILNVYNQIIFLKTQNAYPLIHYLYNAQLVLKIGKNYLFIILLMKY